MNNWKEEFKRLTCVKQGDTDIFENIKQNVETLYQNDYYPNYEEVWWNYFLDESKVEEFIEKLLEEEFSKWYNKCKDDYNLDFENWF